MPDALMTDPTASPSPETAPAPSTSDVLRGFTEYQIMQKDGLVVYESPLAAKRYFMEDIRAHPEQYIPDFMLLEVYPIVIQKEAWTIYRDGCGWDHHNLVFYDNVHLVSRLKSQVEEAADAIPVKIVYEIDLAHPVSVTVVGRPKEIT